MMNAGINIYRRESYYTVVIDGAVWGLDPGPDAEMSRFALLGIYGERIGRAALKVNAGWGKRCLILDMEPAARKALLFMLQEYSKLGAVLR